MNVKQRIQAAQEARARIESGEDPDGLVHILYYPADYAPDEIQGLSSAITLAEYQSGGYTSRYYTLAELASAPSEFRELWRSAGRSQFGGDADVEIEEWGVRSVATCHRYGEPQPCRLYGPFGHAWFADDAWEQITRTR